MAADDVRCCEIRFDSLFNAGRGLSFPCDRAGQVDLDALPPKARSNYLYARSLIGRDYASPVVCARAAVP